ncbi:STAS domain-containing protein [Streptomyces sp. NPDC091271]|uniref:STAS domain-containing protein n=1 Tax=Streptomyces sp. NPDC091271 TaxID=3365980 RepID=UPI00381E9B7D
MTELPCPPLTVEIEAGPGAVRLRLVGDLDFDSSDLLVERAQVCLAADPGPRDLFLDCSGLRLCDSMGVSSLLLIHRGTASRGVALHLENPPAFLRRILDVTGTARLFVLEGAGRRTEQEEGTPPAPPG